MIDVVIHPNKKIIHHGGILIRHFQWSLLTSTYYCILFFAFKKVIK